MTRPAQPAYPARVNRFLLPSLLAVGLTFSAVPASADSCEDECNSGDSCSVRDECPDTGVLCETSAPDYAACVEDAEARGLVEACSDEYGGYGGGEEAAVGRVFCDPDEGGCGVRQGGRSSGAAVATAIFALAAALTAARSARRKA